MEEKLIDFKTVEQAEAYLRKVLQKEKAAAAAIGFDIKKHWEEMLATLPESNKNKDIKKDILD